MKRLFSVMLIVVMLCGLIGCVEESPKDIVPPTQDEDSDVPSTPQTPQENENIPSTPQTPEEPEHPSEDVKPSAPESEQPITVEEQLLVDLDGVKITVKGFVDDSFWGRGLKFLIENTTDKDVTVSLDNVTVNNYMMTGLLYKTVAAGKKATETLYFSDSDLEKCEIEKIEQVELYFYWSNSDTYERIATADKVTVRTSAYEDSAFARADDGYELWNANGVRIVGKYADENSIFGTSVVLFIENNTGKDIIVYCDDLSVNGFMVSSYFYCTVLNEKMIVDTILLSSSDMEENDITEVEDVELKFRAVTESSWDELFETDVVSFSVE